jgi:hypothetical protein
MDCANLELQERNAPETPIMVALKRGGEGQETFAKEVRPSSASLIGTIGFLTMKLRNVQGYHLFRIYWNILYRGSIVSFKFLACLSNTTIREGSIAS